MEALLILPLAGMILPARYALRLGGLGGIALLALGAYGNTPYDPGVGHGLGTAMIFMGFVLLFGGIAAGLVVRWGWHLWRRTALDLAGLAAPPLVDDLLAGLAMVVPAGLVAVMVGSALSGNLHPLAVHLGIFAFLAAVALASGVRLRGLARAAVLGLSLWLAVIVADSMCLERQLLADAARILPDQPRCLAIGPQRLSMDQARPLMGLTTPKPILLRAADGNRVLRWSFRYHGFVKTGIDPQDVPCTPALP